MSVAPLIAGKIMDIRVIDRHYLRRVDGVYEPMWENFAVAHCRASVFNRRKTDGAHGVFSGGHINITPDDRKRGSVWAVILNASLN